jgi:hypothetical protein
MSLFWRPLYRGQHEKYSLSLQRCCADYPSFYARPLLRPRARPPLTASFRAVQRQRRRSRQARAPRGRRRRRTTPACLTRKTVGASLACAAALGAAPAACRIPLSHCWAPRRAARGRLPRPAVLHDRRVRLADWRATLVTCYCGPFEAAALIMRRRHNSGCALLSAWGLGVLREAAKSTHMREV